MPSYICVRCGVQFTPTQESPNRCPICEDERECVNRRGQIWTTLDALRADHHNITTTLEPGLVGIRTEPAFAIGQQALLARAPGGNVLWDCISLIDEATVAAVQALGGIAAIALCHPHLHGSMVEWSHAFDRTPIYVHAADRKWVMRPDPAIVFWEGDAYYRHGTDAHPLRRTL